MIPALVPGTLTRRLVVDPIDAAWSWRGAGLAAATVTTYGPRWSTSVVDPVIVAGADSLLRVGLRVGWIARNTLGHRVDLNDVEAWIAAMSARVPHSAVMLLGAAAKSPRRADRVAAAVALHELSAAPGRLSGRKLGVAARVACEALAEVTRDDADELGWFREGFATLDLRSPRRPTTNDAADGAIDTNGGW